MLRGLVIGGPTGVGKTNLSLTLAKILSGEIISADSAQIYKGLDIGTAKIATEETMGITHHMIDIVEPSQKYNVGQYQRKVNNILTQLEKKNTPVLIAGGTGLYINSITEGFSNLPQVDKNIRESFSSIPNEELFQRLMDVDMESAQSIHINNRVRIERALEIFLLTGQKFSTLSRKNIKKNNYNFLKIALSFPREILYQRINQRVDIMVERGLVDEVTNLYNQYGQYLKKLNIIGYNEIIDYLEKNFSLEKAIDNIKLNSRRYAKRQLTWFKNDSKYFWYDFSQNNEDFIVVDILSKIKKNSQLEKIIT